MHNARSYQFHKVKCKFIPNIITWFIKLRHGKRILKFTQKQMKIKGRKMKENGQKLIKALPLSLLNIWARSKLFDLLTDIKFCVCFRISQSNRQTKLQMDYSNSPEMKSLEVNSSFLLCQAYLMCNKPQQVHIYTYDIKHLNHWVLQLIQLLHSNRWT